MKYLLLIPILFLCGCTGLSRVARGVDGNNSTIEIDLNTPWGPQRLRSIPVAPLLTNGTVKVDGEATRLNALVARPAQMVINAKPAPPLPPLPPLLPGASPLLVARAPVGEPIGKFICTVVSEVLRNDPQRDALGIPTGQWDATMNWFVVLQPIPEDGTNRLWGAGRSGDVRLLSDTHAFTVGGYYEIAPSTP